MIRARPDLPPLYVNRVLLGNPLSVVVGREEQI